MVLTLPVPLAGTVYVWLPPGSQVTLPALSLAMNLYSTAVLAGRVTVLVQEDPAAVIGTALAGAQLAQRRHRADEVDRVAGGRAGHGEADARRRSARPRRVGDGVPPVTRALTWIATASLALALTVAWPEPLTVTVGPLQVPEAVKSPWMTSQYVPAGRPVVNVRVDGRAALLLMSDQPLAPRQKAIALAPSLHQLATVVCPWRRCASRPCCGSPARGRWHAQPLPQQLTSVT